MKTEGLTILIQGPLKEDSACLDFIENYQKYGNVVISCYDDNHKGIKKVKNKFKDVGILRSNAEELTDSFSQGIGFSQNSTFIWALHTMLRGFSDINSEYTLKVRSDEGYEYLDDFINIFLDNDKKIVCGNIFYKTPKSFEFGNYRLHMGDHIFIGKTKILFEAVQNLYSMYLKRDSFKPDKTLYECDAFHCAETVLARSILRQMNPEISKVANSDEEQKFFLDNILPCDTNRFKKFIARWDHADITFENSFDADFYENYRL